jgi:hypothetical protein
LKELEQKESQQINVALIFTKEQTDFSDYRLMSLISTQGTFLECIVEVMLGVITRNQCGFTKNIFYQLILMLYCIESLNGDAVFAVFLTTFFFL